MTKKQFCPKCKHDPHVANDCNERVCDAAGDMDYCPCGYNLPKAINFMAPAMKLATPRVRRLIKSAVKKFVEANPWKEAIIQACIVNFLEWDENDPSGTLSKLIGWENTVALDPKVSKAAYDLLMTPPPPAKTVPGVRVSAEMLRDANYGEVRVDWDGKEWKYCDMCHDKRCPWCYQSNWRTCPRCGGHAVIEDGDCPAGRWWWACAKCKLDVSRWPTNTLGRFRAAFNSAVKYPTTPPADWILDVLRPMVEDELEELVLDGELKRSTHKRDPEACPHCGGVGPLRKGSHPTRHGKIAHVYPDDNWQTFMLENADLEKAPEVLVAEIRKRIL